MDISIVIGSFNQKNQQRVMDGYMGQEHPFHLKLWLWIHVY